MTSRVPLGQEGGELDDNNDLPILDLQARFLGLGTSTRISTDSHQRLGYEAEEEEDIDGLLDELRDKIRANAEDDTEDVNHLVNDAKVFVASSARLTGADDIPTESPAHEDEKLDLEAEEYIQQVMAEIRAHKPEDESGEQQPPEDGNAEKPSQDDNEERQRQPETPGLKRSPETLDLPDTPTSPLRAQPSSDGGPDLPTAPTFLPAEHPIHMTDRRKSRANAPSEPFWCCICSADARIKCVDCDGELLFCPRCWREMHLEEGGPEERRHRAVEFTGNMQGAVS